MFENLINYVKNKYGDPGDEFELCDLLFEHLANGDLNEELDSLLPETLSNEEKKEIWTIVKENIGVCFYDGDYMNWADSVGNPLQFDTMSIAKRVVSNYMFLIKATIKNKSIPNLMSSMIQCEGYNEDAVVNYLRTTFSYDKQLSNSSKRDETLLNVLSLMSDDKFYKQYSPEQLGFLLMFPIGTVYYHDGDEVKYTNPYFLSLEIANRKNDNEEPMLPSEDASEVDKMATELANMFRRVTTFSDVVEGMANEYNTYLKTGEKTEWTINEGNIIHLGTPYVVQSNGKRR